MINSEQFKGYILFVLVNKGSKSEHFAPVLIGENAEAIYLYREGDNPFMYESIRDYHLTYCRVKGVYDEGKNRITISDIEQIADPVMSLWKKTENEIQTEVTTKDKKEDDD